MKLARIKVLLNKIIRHSIVVVVVDVIIITISKDTVFRRIYEGTRAENKALTLSDFKESLTLDTRIPDLYVLKI